MKKFSKTSVAFLSALILMFGVISCGDDDSAPSNRITVDDESYKFSNGYILTNSYTNEDGDEGYEHTVYLTGDGLTIDLDDVEFDGSGNLTVFYLLSTDEDIEEGTYSLEAEDDADFGDASTFVLVTDYNGSTYDDVFSAVEGEIEVSRSGDKYAFKFDFDEYEIYDDEAYVEGEGSITGRFSGELEVITVDDSSRKTNSNPLVNIF